MFILKKMVLLSFKTKAIIVNRISFLIISSIVFYSCSQPTTLKAPKNLIEVGELEEIPELSEEDLEEDGDWVADYEKRKKQLNDLGAEDTKQKTFVMEQKSKVIESKSALKKEVDTILKARAEKKADEIFSKSIANKLKRNSKISSKEIKDLISKASKGELNVEELKQVLIEKLGISSRNVDKLISDAKADGEDVKKILLKKVLEETTTLTEEELSLVMNKVEKAAEETNQLMSQIGNATTAKEIRKILEEAGDISEESIKSIIKKNKKVVEQEKSFLGETMAKLYARLQ
jgi:hypothetical protein